MARFGKDLVTYGAADLLGSSIGLLLSPVFTRLFTPAQYGAQAALAAIWSFVALAQFGGMDSAYPNFRSRTADPAERRRLLATATCIALVSAVIVSGAFAAFCLATPWVRGFAAVSRWETAMYALTLLPGAALAWFLYVLRFEQRAESYAQISLLGRVAVSLLLMPALWWAPVSNRLGIGFLVTAIGTTIASLWGWRELHREIEPAPVPPPFHRNTARHMLRFGLVLVPAGAIYALSSVLDRLIVTAFSGAAETAVLALALRLGMVATMLKTWFALVWDPRLIDWVAAEPRDVLVRRLNRVVTIIALATALVAGLAAIWSERVVRWLYPPEYVAAARLLPWITVGVGCSTLSLVAVATATIARTSKLHLPVYVLGLGVNGAIALWLVPRLGALGAVIGTAAAEIVILGMWIFFGVVRLKNLPLRWAPALAVVLLVAGFVAAYSGPMLSAAAPLVEALGLTLLVLIIAGVPLARRLVAVTRVS